jgi:hypothetical protein
MSKPTCLLCIRHDKQEHQPVSILVEEEEALPFMMSMSAARPRKTSVHGPSHRHDRPEGINFALRLGSDALMQ